MKSEGGGIGRRRRLKTGEGASPVWPNKSTNFQVFIYFYTVGTQPHALAGGYKARVRFRVGVGF